MKIRKKDMVLRGDRNTGKWYLAESVKKHANGQQVLSGKVYEVTDSINPCISHTNQYVRRLEDALLSTVKQLYKERGLTPTDAEIWEHFKKLKDEVS